MKSEVGIFYLELDSDLSISPDFREKLSIFDDPIPDNFEILKDIKTVIKKGKKITIKFDTEFLYFHLQFIIKRFPVCSNILTPIIKNVKDEYELSFFSNNNINITVEIINDDMVEHRFDEALSISSFYEFCYHIKDIAIFYKD